MNQQQLSQKKKRKNKEEINSRKMFLNCCVIASIAIFCFCGKFNAKSNENVEIIKRSETLTSKVQSNTNAEKKEKTKSSTKRKNVDTDAWNLLLVNSTHFVPENFKVELTKINSNHSVDSRIYKDLQSMLNDAKAAGLSPIICSSYRTMEKQTSLFNNEVNNYILSGYSQEEAEKEASRWVAIPGTSEHQIGLAVDIVAESYQILDKGQEETAEQKWLMKHCAEYGFILRYPTDKSNITKIGYEPWHYRYVGKDIAKEIMESGICLEEYLDK